MTYESLLKIFKKSFITWTGIDQLTKKQVTETRDFRTLTIWYGKDGYKICVRWAGGNCDCSSVYRPTIEQAYENLLKAFPNEFRDWQLKFYE